jgi:hypothetical protein
MKNIPPSVGFAQVFLNYPFDDDFEPFSHAMHFGVVAAGLIPICAKDLSAPDHPRLEMLVEAIINCQYSAHDLSKLKGQGDQNLARANMPLEMGMAIFHAFQTQRTLHRCAAFVPTQHEYKTALSDLSSLDLICYEDDALLMVAGVYEWLRDTVKYPLTKSLATAIVKKEYKNFMESLDRIEGGGKDGHPTHAEARELMFSICSKLKWWNWRSTGAKTILPTIPLSWKESDDKNNSRSSKQYKNQKKTKQKEHRRQVDRR